MNYKCIETFSVPELDDMGGNETGNEFVVHKESIWESENRFSESDDEVTLRKDEGSWLEISKELFDSMFEAFSEPLEEENDDTEV